MGNYGNTVDRRYRRAVVVVWPKEKSFAARAVAGSTWTLRTLVHRIDTGHLETARADATSLEPFWLHVDARSLSPVPSRSRKASTTAAARVVLAPFRLERVETTRTARVSC